MDAALSDEWIPSPRTSVVSHSDRLRWRVNVFRYWATMGGENGFIRAAADLGIDITYIDETVPLGEVCGYDGVSLPPDEPGEFKCGFYAIRRFSDCFGDGEGKYTLLSDRRLLYYATRGIYEPLYVTPPRYCADADPPKLVRISQPLPEFRSARLRDMADDCARAPTVWQDTLADAKELGINITYIDDSAPCGEVCGYESGFDHARYRMMFFAVRRVRNNCFPAIKDDFILVSDWLVDAMEYSQKKPYKIPPRWQPDLKAVTRK